LSSSNPPHIEMDRDFCIKNSMAFFKIRRHSDLSTDCDEIRGFKRCGNRIIGGAQRNKKG